MKSLHFRELVQRCVFSACSVVGVSLFLVACSTGTEDPASQGENAQSAANQLAKTLTTADALATTKYGQVQGYVEDQILTFKGVRYGADSSTTRFAAPAEPAAWSEAQDATAFGATCPQTPTGNPGGLFTSWAPVPTPPMSEDCLFLNVWTPALADGVKRPVMVWFHGGGFSSGSGSSRAYDGVRLAKRGDVVVVTVNHRLNVFGYLALGHYGEGFQDSAAAGVLDMIQALTWVRDNIANFGGDPDNVLIFGESGGGAKVSTLMSTDRAVGLFHRAVIQSGAMLRFPDQAKARSAADVVVGNLGLDRTSIGDIHSKTTEEIQAAFAGTGAGAAPTIDGLTLKRHPFQPNAAPAGSSVPLMLGSNRTESSLFVGGANPAIFDITWEALPAALKRSFPSASDADITALIAGYRELEPEAEAADVYFEATTDARYLAGHVLLAERKAAQQDAPVWLYLFNWDTPVDGGKWRSPHALEIGFVFDNVAYSQSMSGSGAEQQKVADTMADTWIAFARNGNPNHAGIPEWPGYDEADRAMMVFDVESQMINDARGAQRQLFNDGEAYGDRYSGR